MTVKQTLGELQQLGIKICASTLNNYLSKQGLQKRVMQLKPFITPAQQSKRLAYAVKHADRDWKDVIFCDKATIKTNGAVRRWVWRKRGEEWMPDCMGPRFKAADKSVHVWAAIWGDGFSELLRLDTSESTSARGGFNSELYADQVLKGPLWTIKTTMELDDRTPWLLHDGSPVHTGGPAAAVIEDEGWQVLDHPPNSPDLNVIENAWAILKHELSMLPRRPTNPDALFEAAAEIWETISGEYVQVLVDSMPRRSDAVRIAKGGATKY
ncbi:hypothetical protein A4X03_0g7938 [Tilletia caries]|uniref:Tc1-like transposase DDE domain-containing protein n=1 Tax=Tilletia caries TaxID=13290 RepID=A0A8T8SN32_9BASI|nr:hypothetical protein CF328_g8259 [Tilletia controversa]KAE8242869.1 hypothetical protein A4X03_0g7938 [Tilletia caries]